MIAAQDDIAARIPLANVVDKLLRSPAIHVAATLSPTLDLPTTRDQHQGNVMGIRQFDRHIYTFLAHWPDAKLRGATTIEACLQTLNSGIARGVQSSMHQRFPTRRR